MDSFLQEVATFKKSWPNVEHIDLVFTDINATPRGKRIPIESLEKLSKGVALPLSTISLDTKGNVVETAGLGEDLGEPDHLCFPITNTLIPTSNPSVGQILLTMTDDNISTPHPLLARTIVENMLDELKERGQYPVIAMELEFYLIDKKRGPNGELQTAVNPSKNIRETETEVYHLDGLDDYAEFLQELNSLAVIQKLNTSGALSESAPGQFEINFNHSENVLKACDDIIFAKRLIRQIANKHGFDATFMAKPFHDQAGSGQHVHISLLNANGRNLFSNLDGSSSELFYQTISAMLAQARGTMALLCPNVNSYRRFIPGAYVPTTANWGENHRGVALRVPISDAKNRRIEHRIAGADVNPYLLVATVLGGVLSSPNYLASQCPPSLNEPAQHLPTRMPEALTALDSSELPEQFSRDFIDLYLACKRSELADFERVVTPLEIDWMLHSA
ncbi:glutamine synthetase family protein [Vibrio marisflavi]|uniref:Gamma-glutamylputrescine synthetase PuuA n=1 Tax=Vibrio marisflavi CECT 7928 TaxID=634439 RepID=A0ABM9A4M1_9VIBR|nr:glutamine synthetase family protein [Vibrio marisflavi]CAH0539665.1 Gamma-glutamylputrescine synthetase PuuA [Vibrio marisflavi CECT 7928]